MLSSLLHLLLLQTLSRSFSTATSSLRSPNSNLQARRGLQFSPNADSIAGGRTCPHMNPFCPNDGTSYNFYLAKDRVQTENTNDRFGCLTSHKGEQWLYITVSSPGNMKFLTTSTVDHDYAVWGPFGSKALALSTCGNLPEPVDCSFHLQAAEQVTCGGGTGTYFYECTEEQKMEEKTNYVVWNLAPWAYKIVFLLSLRYLLGCIMVDLGENSLACFRLNNATWIMLGVNLVLLLLLYCSRCFWPVWLFSFVIWLHVDAIMCIMNRVLDQKPVAKPKTTPPRSNLELFAYTNNKKGWKEKAYSTFELRRHKKDAKIMKKIDIKNSKHKGNLRRPSYRGGAL